MAPLKEGNKSGCWGALLQNCSFSHESITYTFANGFTEQKKVLLRPKVNKATSEKQMKFDSLVVTWLDTIKCSEDLYST